MFSCNYRFEIRPFVLLPIFTDPPHLECLDFKLQFSFSGSKLLVFGKYFLTHAFTKIGEAVA